MTHDQDRPFGWRPLTEEQRQKYRDWNYSEEQIAAQEETNVYQPMPMAVIAFELAMAVAEEMAARDRTFGDSLHTRFKVRTKKLSEGEDVEDRVDSTHAESFLGSDFWTRVRGAG